MGKAPPWVGNVPDWGTYGSSVNFLGHGLVAAVLVPPSLRWGDPFLPKKLVEPAD